MSIHQGTFLESLKIARVIPIFNGETEQLVHDYIPISVLPFFLILLEKVWPLTFLNWWNIILFIIQYIKYQLGFRKNHSTSHAIIYLVEKVSKALDTRKYVVGVYLYKKIITWIMLYCLKNLKAMKLEELYITGSRVILLIEGNMLNIIIIFIIFIRTQTGTT